MKFLDYNLSLELPSALPSNKTIVKTLNPHSYCLALEDDNFRSALKHADALLPDGVGIVWASKFLYRRRIKKISGFDLHLHYLSLLNEVGGKVFYMGSTNQTLKILKEKVKSEYPNLQVGTYSPPFKAEFSKTDSNEILNQINAFNPDILFVGLTAPKQEKWIYAHRDRLNAKVIGAIGAVFDFYAGTVKRSSPFWIRLGLEWLPRFLKEPKRLWRRNLISTPQFILLMVKEKLKLMLS
jgi:N-acetylglucosaminyldiphosphoundecaprenol N-acetyl-beta-D-mannosaminyltransferase